MNKSKLEYRKLIKISKVESAKFLQSILSNNIDNIYKKKLQYNLLLSPQGKILYDFFIFKLSQDFYLDCHIEFLESIKNKLQSYKLHSDIKIEILDIDIFILDKNFNVYCYLDPRNPNLGYRYYDFDESEKGVDNFKMDMIRIYNEQRLQYLVPELGIDFMPEEFFPLHFGMDNLNAISFSKGCYVGQEVTARMKYRGKGKKYLKCIKINDYEIRGQDIIQDDKKIGIVLKIYHMNVLALLNK